MEYLISYLIITVFLDIYFPLSDRMIVRWADSSECTLQSFGLNSGTYPILLKFYIFYVKIKITVLNLEYT